MSSRKHHKVRRCPIKGCRYIGGELRRHLRSNKHRGDVDPKVIDGLIQVVDKGKERKGSNGLLMRWCPVEGCTLVTSYLSKHLERTHGITKAERRNALRKMSTCYEPNQLPPSTAVSIQIDTSSDEPGTENNDDNDDDDDEDYKAPSVKAFFEPRRITSNRHWFLVQFYNHLGSVDEGQKNDKIRCQHACQMRKILEDIDPKGKDIEKITAEEGRAVWNLWMSKRLENENSVKAGTLLSYLGSFSKFLKFAVMSQKRRKSDKDTPRLPDETIEVFNEIIEKIPGWRTTIVKQSAAERNQHYLKECEERITREDFEAFLRSSIITEAESLFSPARKCHGIQQFARARDYLIARLAVCCGTRPRPLETATLDHFEHASRDSVYPDCYVMLVPAHKRQMDGPAIVTMDERLHEFIRIYIRDIRSLLGVSPEERHLFLKIDGQPFEPGTIGNRVSELWSRSGVRPGIRVTCTDFRKAIVTMVEEANKEERCETGRVCIDDNDLRKLLCHSQKTATLWYMRENLTAVGARAHTTLQRIREGTWKGARREGNTRPSETATSTAQLDYNSRSIQVDENLSSPEVPSLPSSPPTVAVAPIASVSGSSSSSTSLSPTQSDSLTHEIPGSSSAPPPSFSTGRPRALQRWSQQDSAVIREFVKSFKGRCPGKQEVYDAFQTLPELITISNRNDFKRCFEKVKYTFAVLTHQGQSSF